MQLMLHNYKQDPLEGNALSCSIDPLLDLAEEATPICLAALFHHLQEQGFEILPVPTGWRLVLLQVISSVCKCAAENLHAHSLQPGSYLCTEMAEALTFAGANW